MLIHATNDASTLTAVCLTLALLLLLLLLLLVLGGIVWFGCSTCVMLPFLPLGRFREFWLRCSWNVWLDSVVLSCCLLRCSWCVRLDADVLSCCRLLCTSGGCTSSSFAFSRKDPSVCS